MDQRQVVSVDSFRVSSNHAAWNSAVFNIGRIDGVELARAFHDYAINQRQCRRNNHGESRALIFLGGHADLTAGNVHGPIDNIETNTAPCQFGKLTRSRKPGPKNQSQTLIFRKRGVGNSLFRSRGSDAVEIDSTSVIADRDLNAARLI